MAEGICCHTKKNVRKLLTNYCTVCMETKSTQMLPCGHQFCGACIGKQIVWVMISNRTQTLNNNRRIKESGLVAGGVHHHIITVVLSAQLA